MHDPIVRIRSTRWGNYLIAFAITALIFATALYVSNYFNDRRISDIRATQDNISTDILSLQTQFDLLQERSCADIAENTVLPSQLQTLANQLSYMEGQGFTDQDEVTRLKRLYSLLEIKDYLLMKQFAVRCGLKPIFILYFYSNTGDCKDCEKQGYVLTSLARNYPQLRIYSFDYNLDVSALRTLISINDIQDQMPALIIAGKTYYGYHSVSDIEKILPQLATLKKTSATSTPVKK
jgi:hypothetical protein